MAFLKFIFVLLIIVPLAAFMLYILKNLAKQVPKQKKTSNARRKTSKDSGGDYLRDEFYKKEKL